MKDKPCDHWIGFDFLSNVPQGIGIIKISEVKECQRILSLIPNERIFKFCPWCGTRIALKIKL